MVRIINDKNQVKSYIEKVKAIFDTYRISKNFDIMEDFRTDSFIKILSKIEENSDSFGNELKTKILKENLLGNRNLESISEETKYSLSRLYAIRQKMLKEFATILFEVILI